MTHNEPVFLSPRKKLVDAVTDWLTGHARKDKKVGADSLAHICVVVPTAQSGRNLRLALAKRFPNGLVPPMVVQPMQLARGTLAKVEVANKVQTGAAFLKFMENCKGVGAKGEWPTLFKRDSLADPDALLSFLDQLEELWELLGAGGLSMQDVPGNPAANKVLEGDLGDELARWMELADFEKRFFGFMHENGLRHAVEILRDAKLNPPDLPHEIEEVVLPALADPVPVLYVALANQRIPRQITVLLHCDEADKGKFDEWGRPCIKCWTGDNRPDLSGKLRDGDIVCAAADGKLAKKIADEFPEEKSDLAIPSLGLCDDALFDSLSAALLGKGWELHNPEKFRLSASSLGRIAGRLVSLYAVGSGPFPWDEFTGLLREDDVLRRVKARLEKEGEDGQAGSDEKAGEGNNQVARMAILEGIDICRNTFCPTMLPKGCQFDLEAVAEWKRCEVSAFLAAAEALCKLIGDARKDAQSVAAFLRNALIAIFAGRMAGDAADEKEFDAAAAALREVLAQFDDVALAGFDPSGPLATALLRKRLADATYSLEPDSPSALRTEGWLELAWSDCDKVVLAGFREGAVPDSVSGHVFLPDSLRAALGLPSNDRRLARDTFLLKSILDARNPGDVRAYFARTGDKGDIHRPSRLLFLVGDDAVARRAKSLFGELPPDEARAPRIIAQGWRPRLPDDVPLPSRDDKSPDGRLSSSAIDEWLNCPFSYFLKYGLGMERVEEKDELGADNFGTLVHEIFESYAKKQMELTGRNLPQLSNEQDIKKEIGRIFDAVRKRYATADLKVGIQLDSIGKRLENFAAIQAHWAQQGWRIVGAEVEFLVRPFAGEEEADVFIKGKVDRIDYHAEKDVYRLIDFKTWDKKGDAAGHVLTGGMLQIAHAQEFALPTTDEETREGKPKPRRFLSVQLPLYGRCLEALDPGKFNGKIVDYCYLVLGKNMENTRILGSGLEEKESKRAKDEGREAFGIGSFNLADPELRKKALDTARAAIRGIRANLFWPPGPGNSLRYGGLKAIFLNSPESDLKDSDWVKKQEERLHNFVLGRKVEDAAKEERP